MIKSTTYNYRVYFTSRDEVLKNFGLLHDDFGTDEAKAREFFVELVEGGYTNVSLTMTTTTEMVIDHNSDPGSHLFG